MDPRIPNLSIMWPAKPKQLPTPAQDTIQSFHLQGIFTRGIRKYILNEELLVLFLNIYITLKYNTITIIQFFKFFSIEYSKVVSPNVLGQMATQVRAIPNQRFSTFLSLRNTGLGKKRFEMYLAINNIYPFWRGTVP